CMKLTYGLWISSRHSTGTAGGTSSPPRPRPCGASSSKSPAANRVPNTAGILHVRTLTPWTSPCPRAPGLVLALDEALQRLAEQSKSGGEVVQLRFSAGLPLPGVAKVLGISPRTADRLWAYTRVWLHKQVQGNGLKSSDQRDTWWCGAGSIKGWQQFVD